MSISTTILVTFVLISTGIMGAWVRSHERGKKAKKLYKAFNNRPHKYLCKEDFLLLEKFALQQERKALFFRLRNERHLRFGKEI